MFGVKTQIIRIIRNVKISLMGYRLSNDTQIRRLMLHFNVDEYGYAINPLGKKIISKQNPKKFIMAKFACLIPGSLEVIVSPLSNFSTFQFIFVGLFFFHTLQFDFLGITIYKIMLTPQGSNLHSPEPKSDVLPITPGVNYSCGE